MSVRVYISRQKYILKDGTVKYCRNRCTYKVSGIKSTGRPKKDLSQYNINDILDFIETHNMKETYEHFTISRYLFRKLIQSHET